MLVCFVKKIMKKLILYGLGYWVKSYWGVKFRVNRWPSTFEKIISWLLCELETCVRGHFLENWKRIWEMSLNTRCTNRVGMKIVKNVFNLWNEGKTPNLKFWKNSLRKISIYSNFIPNLRKVLFLVFKKFTFFSLFCTLKKKILKRT